VENLVVSKGQGEPVELKMDNAIEYLLKNLIKKCLKNFLLKL
jgi:hypothetical protein